MIEKEILDRVPLNPGRITLFPVDGMENTFDMARADNPSVEGTPLNKATLDSIIQSRLTGRYYELSANRVLRGSAETITVNPVPTTWKNATLTYADSGLYVVRASGANNTNTQAYRAFDGVSNTYWNTVQIETEAWLSLELPAAITVKKISLCVSWGTGTAGTFLLQGSNDGSTWSTLGTYTAKDTAPVERTISAPSSYKYYRIYTTRKGDTIAVYSFDISEYDMSSYTNEFTVSSGWPSEFAEGQIAMIQAPADTNTVGVVSNTINRITCGTVLQAGKRYELVYNGTAFDAKEV